MPDHGEVCGLPWEYEVLEDGTCLHCWVYGVRFPYRLDKRIRFYGKSQLEIEYEVVNLSPFDMDFIWAGHVMIAAEEESRIIVPYEDGVSTTCMFSSDEAFAKPGDVLRWPVHQTSDGGMIDISKTQPKKSGKTYKYYFDRPMPQGQCGYVYRTVRHCFWMLRKIRFHI